MKITADGLIPVPPSLREQLGLHPDTEIEFERDGEWLRLRKSVPPAPTRGEQLVAALRTQAHAWGGMSTEELMELTRGPFNDLDPQP